METLPERPQQPLHEYLRAHARERGGSPACIWYGHATSWDELDRASDAFAARLQALGVKKGEPVVLFLNNCPQYLVAHFGIQKIGAIVCPSGPLNKEHELAYQVNDLKARVIVAAAPLLPVVRKVQPESSLEHVFVVHYADLLPAEPALDLPPELAAERKAGRATAEGCEDFLAVMRADARPQPVAIDMDDVALMTYTSGTTGLPKGAMLTHANLTSASAQYYESTRGEPPILEEGKERFLVVLPLFHIFALSAAMLLGVRLGAALVLHTRFDVDAVMNELAASRISVFPGVPTMYTAILSHPKAREMDLRSLKFCGSGGAPLPVEVEQRFFELTGCHLNEGWGMTETSPVGTFTPARGLRKAGSCGMPLPQVRIKLVSLDDPSKDVTAFGEAGELCIKGPNVMKGYWNNPKATADSMTSDGYFRSGDVAKMDADGYLYIVDRTKDMLLCGGYNVYPRVLEEAVYEHPSVAEVCVIGIPDEYRGQSPKAFVKLKDGAPELTLDELKAFLKNRLGKHEMIGALEIRAELPKTPVGKLSKKDLVDEEARKRA